MINTEYIKERLEYALDFERKGGSGNYTILEYIQSLLKMIEDLNERLISLENDCDKAGIPHA